MPTRLDLESQLFSILKTLKTIHEDMINGRLSYSSYCNIVRQKINELMIVELSFQSKGLYLDAILNEMMVSEEFFTLIPKIHDYVALTAQKKPEMSKSFAKIPTSGTHPIEQKIVYLGNHAINPIRLANLASEITANFITIFDFFKLELGDPNLLQDNINRLEGALKEFPGLEELYLDFKSFLRENKPKFSEMNNTLPILESFVKLYQRFLAFLKQPSNL